VEFVEFMEVPFFLPLVEDVGFDSILGVSVGGGGKVWGESGGSFGSLVSEFIATDAYMAGNPAEGNGSLGGREWREL
jgi:hypothetical protein